MLILPNTKKKCTSSSIKSSPVIKGAVLLIRIYQHTFSVCFGGQCRFIPTCSEFAAEALMKKGFVSGGWATLKRLARCHPCGDFGFDPVKGENRK